MEQNESPEINAYFHGQLVLYKGAKAIQWGKTFSTNPHLCGAIREGFLEELRLKLIPQERIGVC